MQGSIDSAPLHCVAPSTRGGLLRRCNPGLRGTPRPTYRRRSVTSLRTSPGAMPVSESDRRSVTSASLTRRKPRRCWLILMRHDLGCERSLHMFSSPPSMSMSCSRYSKSWGIAPAVENAAGEVMVTPPTRRAEKHLAESKPVRSAAQVADALLAGEGSRQVAMGVGAGPTTADVGLSISRGTVARSIE